MLQSTPYGFEATDENINKVFGESLGWPFLLKTNYTGYGYGVTLCHTPAEVRAAAHDNWSELIAIQQILLGFTSAPLVKEFFGNGYTNLGNITIEQLKYQFKRVNQAKND